MVLQSLWERKDKFGQWIVFDEWRNNAWKNEPGFKYYVDSCMTSSQWWDDVKVVLDTIGLLYLVLRYVDGDEGTIAGMMPRLLSAIMFIYVMTTISKPNIDIFLVFFNFLSQARLRKKRL